MMPTLRQRAANAITAMHAASTMFAMHAMLGRLAAQLKMPRPDAYTAEGSSALLARTKLFSFFAASFAEGVC